MGATVETMGATYKGNESKQIKILRETDAKVAVTDLEWPKNIFFSRHLPRTDQNGY